MVIKVIITLKDGSSKEYEAPMSVIDIAADISEGLARVACAGEIDGEVVDLRTVVDKDCSLNILTANDKAGLQVVRHTASHVLAEAVSRMMLNWLSGPVSIPDIIMILNMRLFPGRIWINWKLR